MRKEDLDGITVGGYILVDPLANGRPNELVTVSAIKPRTMGNGVTDYAVHVILRNGDKTYFVAAWNIAPCRLNTRLVGITI